MLRWFLSRQIVGGSLIFVYLLKSTPLIKRYTLSIIHIDVMINTRSVKNASLRNFF